MTFVLCGVCMALWVFPHTQGIIVLTNCVIWNGHPESRERAAGRVRGASEDLYFEILSMKRRYRLIATSANQKREWKQVGRRAAVLFCFFFKLFVSWGFLRTSLSSLLVRVAAQSPSPPSHRPCWRTVLPVKTGLLASQTMLLLSVSSIFLPLRALSFPPSSSFCSSLWVRKIHPRHLCVVLCLVLASLRTRCLSGCVRDGNRTPDLCGWGWTSLCVLAY